LSSERLAVLRLMAPRIRWTAGVRRLGVWPRRATERVVCTAAPTRRPDGLIDVPDGSRRPQPPARARPGASAVAWRDDAATAVISTACELPGDVSEAAPINEQPGDNNSYNQTMFFSPPHRPVLVVVLLGLVSTVWAQDVAGPPEAPREAPPDTQPKQVAWQIGLGLRVYKVDHIFPLVDRVVLVPDTATYLHELGNWSPKGRWPVLIEDDHLAPMFIRRFKPAEVIRRAPVKLPETDQRPLRARINEAIIRTWGGTPGEETLADAFRRIKYVPPGVVITSVDDPAWTAAVALAAGWGQPVAWLDGPLGRPNETMDAEQTKALCRRIDEFIGSLGLPYADLGDAIEAITLCRAVAGKAEVTLPQSAQPSLQSVGLALPQQPAPPYAITDLIGRHEDGRRYAITGWIFGDETYCAYAAMCSLFLPRTQVSFISVYAKTKHWAAYDPAGAAQSLSEAGYDVQVITGADTRPFAWQTLLAGGMSSDVILMNTAGMPDYFDLTGDRAYAQDVPILNEPAAVHLVHSWALAAPEDPHTVGGRWRERGVYAMVGAMDEPFLAAFVTPAELAMRFTRYGPFLVSARQYKPHPFSAPWKVNTLGDPLMLMPTPEMQRRERLKPDPSGGTNVTEEARTLMRACDGDDADAETFAEAIATLDLLGKDAIAVELWRLAAEKGFAAEAARAALGPLFRQNQRKAFLRAWRAAPIHDDRDRDMLWHIMGPYLRVLRNKETAELLASNLRPPNVAVDLERLAPRLATLLGDEYVFKLILQHLEQTQNPLARAELLGLRDKYRPNPPAPTPPETPREAPP
jgi:hypothetical protein